MSGLALRPAYPGQTLRFAFNLRDESGQPVTGVQLDDLVHLHVVDESGQDLDAPLTLQETATGSYLLSLLCPAAPRRIYGMFEEPEGTTLESRLFGWILEEFRAGEVWEVLVPVTIPAAEGTSEAAAGQFDEGDLLDLQVTVNGEALAGLAFAIVQAGVGRLYGTPDTHGDLAYAFTLPAGSSGEQVAGESQVSVEDLAASHYVTVPYCDTVLAGHPDGDSWAALPAYRRAQLRNEAEDDVDGYPFQGSRRTGAQEHAWDRYRDDGSPFDPDLYETDGDIAPRDVKRAVCDHALWLAMYRAKLQAHEVNEAAGIVHAGSGPGAVSYATAQGSRTSVQRIGPAALRRLRRFLA